MEIELKTQRERVRVREKERCVFPSVYVCVCVLHSFACRPSLTANAPPPPPHQMEDDEPTTDMSAVTLEHEEQVYAVAVSPTNPDLIATACGNDTGALWRKSEGKLLHSLGGHTDTVVDVAFSASGNYLATAGMDSLVIPDSLPTIFLFLLLIFSVQREREREREIEIEREMT
jgi:WD40 repeat protein